MGKETRSSCGSSRNWAIASLIFPLLEHRLARFLRNFFRGHTYVLACERAFAKVQAPTSCLCSSSFLFFVACASLCGGTCFARFLFSACPSFPCLALTIEQGASILHARNRKKNAWASGTACMAQFILSAAIALSRELLSWFDVSSDLRAYIRKETHIHLLVAFLFFCFDYIFYDIGL